MTAGARAIAAALLVVVSGLVTDASAEPLVPTIPPARGADPQPTIDAASRWYTGERIGSVVLLGVGLSSLGGGVLLASRDGAFEDGLGITWGIVGGLQTAFAASYAAPLYARQAQLEDDLRREPEGTRRAERDRMRGIADRFVIYRVSEGVLAATGAGLIIGGVAAEEEAVLGVGVGLASEAVALFVFDLFVEARAHAYLDHLEGASAARPTMVATRDGALVGLAGAF